MNLTSWQREITRKLERGATRLVLLQVLNLSDTRGLIRLSRVEVMEITAHTGLDFEAINDALKAAELLGLLRVWRPDHPKPREPEELIIELLE